MEPALSIMSLMWLFLQSLECLWLCRVHPAKQHLYGPRTYAVWPPAATTQLNIMESC